MAGFNCSHIKVKKNRSLCYWQSYLTLKISQIFNQSNSDYQKIIFFDATRVENSSTRAVQLKEIFIAGFFPRQRALSLVTSRLLDLCNPSKKLLSRRGRLRERVFPSISLKKRVQMLPSDQSNLILLLFCIFLLDIEVDVQYMRCNAVYLGLAQW